MDLEGVNILDGRETRSRRGWLVVVAWGTTHHQHHLGVITITPRQHGQASSGRPQRGSTEASKTLEGDHLSRVLSGRLKSAPGGLRCRDLWEMV